MYRMDELLLIELLTYLPDIHPFTTIETAGGKTVAEYVNAFAWDEIGDEQD